MVDGGHVHLSLSQRRSLYVLKPHLKKRPPPSHYSESEHVEYLHTASAGQMPVISVFSVIQIVVPPWRYTPFGKLHPRARSFPMRIHNSEPRSSTMNCLSSSPSLLPSIGINSYLCSSLPFPSMKVPLMKHDAPLFSNHHSYPASSSPPRCKRNPPYSLPSLTRTITPNGISADLSDSSDFAAVSH